MLIAYLIQSSACTNPINIRGNHSMADNANAPLQIITLLAIALMPLVLRAAEVPAAVVPNDPFIDAVFECHSKYVEDYTSIANTASSIADRAAAQCKEKMDAYERHALPPAADAPVDQREVEEQRNRLVSPLKESLRAFTMESAVRFGATSD